MIPISDFQVYDTPPSEVAMLYGDNYWFWKKKIS